MSWIVAPEWDESKLARLERVLQERHGVRMEPEDPRDSSRGPRGRVFRLSCGGEVLNMWVLVGDDAEYELGELAYDLPDGPQAERVRSHILGAAAYVSLHRFTHPDAVAVTDTIEELLGGHPPLRRVPGAWYLGEELILRDDEDEPEPASPARVPDVSGAGPDSATMEEALERLDRLMPERAAELWTSRRPPVTDADLDRLRRAVAPYELPADLITLLRWSDGVPGDWWPSLSVGALLGAGLAADLYERMWKASREDPTVGIWSRCLVPVFQEGWWQGGLEMVDDRPGVIVDGSNPDSPFTVIAPSLLAAVDVVGGMLALDVCLDPVAELERDVLMARRREWATWPYDREPGRRPEGWPPHWRAGLDD
jgi:hypothetical protein